MRLVRKVQSVQKFTTYLEEHRRNACCEILPQVVWGAIILARQVPFDSNSPYRNQAEQHPAMMTLAQWWNENAPNQKHRCAGHAKVWVRVEDNHEYWSSYRQEPERSIVQGIAKPEAVARWGDFLLVEFAKSRSTVYEDEGLICEDVFGDIFDIVAGGVSLEDYDPAWYGLVGLKQFPERFPIAWQNLCEAINTIP